jgi:beta-glucosidase
LLVLACSCSALAQTAPAPTIHPERWPVARSPVRRDPVTERRITQMLARMSVDEKVGQTLSPR